MDQRFADVFQLSSVHVSRMHLARLILSSNREHFEVAVNFIRQIVRNNASVLLEDLFDEDESDAFEIFKR